MTKRIQKAIDIFLDAINNGTLAKGTCIGCAVGNLVANGMGCTIDLKNAEPLEVGDWGLLFQTNIGKQNIYNLNAQKLLNAYKNIRATDFNFHELRAIEKTFENNTNIHFYSYHKHTKEEIRADQIKGLEAVVKVMLEFDSSKEDVKKVFTEKAELIMI